MWLVWLVSLVRLVRLYQTSAPLTAVPRRRGAPPGERGGVSAASSPYRRRRRGQPVWRRCGPCGARCCSPDTGRVGREPRRAGRPRSQRRQNTAAAAARAVDHASTNNSAQQPGHSGRSAGPGTAPAGSPPARATADRHRSVEIGLPCHHQPTAVVRPRMDRLTSDDQIQWPRTHV